MRKKKKRTSFLVGGLSDPLLIPLWQSKDGDVKCRFYDIRNEEYVLDHSDERAFYRTALEFRHKLGYSPRQQEKLIQFVRTRYGLSVA